MKLQKFLAQKGEWIVLVFLLTVFFASKIFLLAPYFADGWIYFYFGKIVAAGDLPYRDFYYSSPPLIPYLMGFLHTLFGFNLTLANALPTFFSLVDAVLIFVLLREKIANFVFIAIALYLFSFANFGTTNYFSEAHPLTTFALAGFLFFENRKLFWSGIFFGLAGLTKLYGLIPAVLLPLLILREPKNLVRFFGGIFVSFGIPNLIFLALIGREYLDFIFFNHLEKGVGIPKSRLFGFFARHDWQFLLLPFFTFFVRNKKSLQSVALALFALALFYLIFADIYYLYLKIFVALLAIFIAFIFAGKFCVIEKKMAIQIAAVTFLFGTIFSANFYFTENIATVRINNLPEIAAAVVENTRSDEQIYGDFEITPLVALAADRSIFQNYIDTNPKFIDLEIVDPVERARELLEGGVKIILTKTYVDPRTRLLSGLNNLLPEEFFAENCEIQKTFPIQKDYEDNAIILWSCE